MQDSLKWFHRVLIGIQKDYDNPPVYVFENGFPDYDELIDSNRINYIDAHFYQSDINSQPRSLPRSKIHSLKSEM